MGSADHTPRDDLHAIRKALENVSDRQNSFSTRAWDVAMKLSVSGVVGAFIWILSLKAVVDENAAYIKRIEETRFTEADGLRLKQEMFSRYSELQSRIGDIPLRIRDELTSWAGTNFPPAWMKEALSRIEVKVDAMDTRLDTLERSSREGK